MNKLFVGNKPAYMTSTGYLARLKRKYGRGDCGFSGTLDPFAKGCLIIAFGQYTKLFRFFKKSQKTYKAVIWIGAKSESLDIENISTITIEDELDIASIKTNIENLIGEHTYIPPKYSAKWINGKRAYNLARAGFDVNIKPTSMKVFDAKFLSYRHPFIKFEATVSEGAYIRSLAQILLERLGTFGTLSYLERTAEGDFIFENEKSLNPIDFLDIEENFYIGRFEDFDYGKKMTKDEFKNNRNGIYFIRLPKHITIIEITDEKVKYLLNKVEISGN